MKHSLCQAAALAIAEQVDGQVRFEHEANAAFLEATRARLQEFTLSLHPEKTRLIEFGRRPAVRRAQRGLANWKPSRS